MLSTCMIRYIKRVRIYVYDSKRDYTSVSFCCATAASLLQEKKEFGHIKSDAFNL